MSIVWPEWLMAEVSGRRALGRQRLGWIDSVNNKSFSSLLT